MFQVNAVNLPSGWLKANLKAPRKKNGRKYEWNTEKPRQKEDRLAVLEELVDISVTTAIEWTVNAAKSEKLAVKGAMYGTCMLTRNLWRREWLCYASQTCWRERKLKRRETEWEQTCYPVPLCHFLFPDLPVFLGPSCHRSAHSFPCSDTRVLPAVFELKSNGQKHNSDVTWNICLSLLVLRSVSLSGVLA